MKWFIRVTTAKGTLMLPLNSKGYRNKKDAESQAELAKRIPENLKVEILKVR